MIWCDVICSYSYYIMNTYIRVRVSIDFKTGDFEYVRMDAMVADRLTSSPRIYDIYGFCGMAIMSEYFPYGDYEDVAVPGTGYLLTTKEQIEQQENELTPYNDIESIEKLRISLQMAEALADLHGDPNGAIVHQDVQLSQYLLSSDGKTVKLNDFNRAEFMLWDDNKGTYCKYGEGGGNGNVSFIIYLSISLFFCAGLRTYYCVKIYMYSYRNTFLLIQIIFFNLFTLASGDLLKNI